MVVRVCSFCRQNKKPWNQNTDTKIVQSNVSLFQGRIYTVCSKVCQSLPNLWPYFMSFLLTQVFFVKSDSNFARSSRSFTGVLVLFHWP